ncbi:sigma-70 family RNA polymerase sigma factor [Clostridioides difficile]|nr:sigma-70 family RNA polymerase sigma factor [Clostridioides difficile]
MNNQEINELVLKFKNGDELAFEALLREFDKEVKITANILLKTNSNIDKDDLIQSGYIGLYKGAKSFRLKGMKYPKAFLIKCIKNEMLKFVIQQKRIKHQFINKALSIEPKHYEVLSNNTLIEEEVISMDISKKVINYINYLPKKQQKVMRLYAKGFDVTKISKLSKYKRKMVEDNLYDATESLRELCLDNIYL